MIRVPLLVVLVFVILAGPAIAGITIESVAVVPSGTIHPDDPVAVEVVVYSTTVPVFAFQPTEVSQVARDIDVELFLDAGDGDAITWETYTIDLGMLPPGIYSYTVTLTPGPNTFGGGVQSGSFQVVNPLPAMSAWGHFTTVFFALIAGLAALARRPRQAASLRDRG